MAIVPLIKINIVSLKKYEKEVLDWLQDVGIAQIELAQKSNNESGDADECKDNESGDSTIDYDLAGIDFALRYLNLHRIEEKKTFWQKLAPGKIRIQKKKIAELAKTFDYRALIKKTENMETEINQTKNELLKLENEKKTLIPWQRLGQAPSEMETETTKGKLAIIGRSNFLNLKNEIEEKVKESEIKILNEDEKNFYLTIYFKKEREKEIDELFLKHKVFRAELPYGEMRPDEALKKVGAEIKKQEKKLGDFDIMTGELARDYKKLQIIFDFLTWEKEKKEAREKFLKTEATFTIGAWIEEANFKKAEKDLLKLTKNNILIKVLPQPEKLDEVPVAIRNKPIITPFESVTGIYGMPKTNELDPTPFLAPFFILFFAICLSDAGYGIILAVLAWLGIKAMKVPKENQKLFRVLIYGGVVTFIVGALFGGWFGIELETLKEGWIKTVLLTLKVVDPIKSPIAIMLLAFALGVLQILAGIGVKMYWKFKNKDYVSGILDSGLWIVFIISLLVWVLNSQAIHSAGLGAIFKWLTLGFMAALILTQGRTQKNPILKLGSGVMSLYGLVGYLSDVLSYSRLLALGLATGIIALVVNLIAMILKDMLPSVLGWLVAIGVLIGGHVFNLGINALGAFIHSGRLQFVEFFPKFMEGGGSRFKPLKRESKFVEVVK